MDMKKNDKFVLTIEDMSEDGAGIGKLDGYIWFVKDALIGDVIEASAMKMKKNYGFARLVRVIEAAPGRVEPKCPVARACGGCQMQELAYAEQLKFKEKKVYNHLKRIGADHRYGESVALSQQGTVPDRNGQKWSAGGRFLCGPDPFADSGAGAGLSARM